MEDIDYWKLADEYSISQAALLIIGSCPSEDLKWPGSLPGYDATFSALKNAIIGGRLKATVRHSSWETGYYEEPERGNVTTTDQRGRKITYDANPDWTITTVMREDLTEWLSSRNFRPAFFFDQKPVGPDYLDKKNPHYSPKLAAAVQAWLAVTNEDKYLNNGRSPKTNLENWLNSHAAEFKLMKEDGTINADAIKNQTAKVANWEPEGGAPKTPGNPPPIKEQ